VVVDVAGGFGGGHAAEGVADGDALVEGGQDAEFHHAFEGGLADEDDGERAGGVHLGVGQHTNEFELVVIK
jgi:hypothetical protein